MSSVVDAVRSYFASQWPGFLTGAVTGVGVMLGAAIMRVVGDRYRKQQELAAVVAAACCRCLSLIENVAYETVFIEDAIESGLGAPTSDESPELPAMRQLMLERWTTGERFNRAAGRYLDYWVNRLNFYRDGGMNFSNEPRPTLDELRRAVLTSIPPHIRALVAKGWNDEHERAERDTRLKPLTRLATRISDVWVETAQGLDDTRLVPPKRNSEP
ncbi:hypothetical protein JKA73_10835 [Myxococcus xanthus]|uniref:hypothetical protein n=1 Tax=Myxococcus xanthus TaxID=34 RepID=UPI00191753DD|nr:hypothetical protein [Myxococcus xanthus]QQR46523.1 hypothetical protein JKA73_10835 [Myxococcus xanthus]